MALATLAQLKMHLGIKPSDASIDSKLGLFLGAGSSWVESYCNRRFEQRSYTELFNGSRTNFLNVREYPVTAITEIRISSERDWSSASTLVASSDYGIGLDGLGISYYAGTFPRGTNNIRAVYTAGYSTLPEDLTLACLWAAEWFYLHNNRGDSGRTSVSKQSESIGVLADVPPMIKSILQPYKRIELASTGSGIVSI